MDKSDKGDLGIRNRVTNGRSATFGIPAHGAFCGQTQTRDLLDALIEMHRGRSYLHDVRATMLIKDISFASEEMRERLAAVAIADGAIESCR